MLERAKALGMNPKAWVLEFERYLTMDDMIHQRPETRVLLLTADEKHFLENLFRDALVLESALNEDTRISDTIDRMDDHPIGPGRGGGW